MSDMSLLDCWPEPFCLDPCEDYGQVDEAHVRRRHAIIDGNVGLRWWFWALDNNLLLDRRQDSARFKLWMHRLAYIAGLEGPSTSWAADWRIAFQALLAEFDPPGTVAGTHEVVILRIRFVDGHAIDPVFVGPFPSYEAAEVWQLSPQRGREQEDDRPEDWILQMEKGACQRPLRLVHPDDAAGGVA